MRKWQEYCLLSFLDYSYDRFYKVKVKVSSKLVVFRYMIGRLILFHRKWPAASTEAESSNYCPLRAENAAFETLLLYFRVFLNIFLKKYEHLQTQQNIYNINVT